MTATESTATSWSVEPVDAITERQNDLIVADSGNNRVVMWELERAS